jgi:hypothetical protein
MPDRGRTTTPPPWPRSTTLEGMPMVTRPSDPPIAEPSRSRLTLTFSGPPLALEETSEEPERPSLELSVTDEPYAADVEAHDAWIADRKRRATPPPRASLGGLQAIPPAPLPPSPAGAPRRSSSSGSLPAVVDGPDAYHLIERSRPSLTLDLASEVAERFALGDFTGALRVAELLLGADPENEEARGYAARCRERLEQFYQSRLGSFERTAHVAVEANELRWLGLDHRAGFFLSHVDGMTSVDDLLDLSGMPRLEALKTLVELLDMGAVRLD